VVLGTKEIILRGGEDVSIRIFVASRTKDMGSITKKWVFYNVICDCAQVK
jgi:hypothetical protein